MHITSPEPAHTRSAELPSYEMTVEISHTHSSACKRMHNIKRTCTSIFSPVRRLMHNLGWFMVAAMPDWILLFIMGTAMYQTWVDWPNYDKFIPLAKDGTLYRPDLAYPYIPPVFSATLAGVLSAVIPLAVFAITQIAWGSFVDFFAATLGLGYSLVSGTLIQVILKKTIGGFRPHFLSVCQPDITGVQGQGYNKLMYNITEICNWENDTPAIMNALESFPSGHAVIVFAAFGYLAIYLFAHLQISNSLRRSVWDGVCIEYWRMVVVLAPVVFATYVSCTLVTGYQHHAHDVIFGAMIGTTTAVFGYRLSFRGLLNPKYNTVPYLLTEEAYSENKARKEELAGGPLS